MNWAHHRKILLKNPDFQKALEESQPELQIAKAVIEARIKNGLSQKELATKMKTKQSVISRLENARTTPSITLLKRLAEALNLTFSLQIRPE